MTAELSTQYRGVGAKRTRQDGYVEVCVSLRPAIWRREHRVVVEKVLGRRLLGTESVHHVNGVKSDNAPENLEVWTSLPQPAGQRVADLVGRAKLILEEHGETGEQGQLDL